MANLEVFSGGVPPLAFFEGRVDDLTRIVEREPDETGLNTVLELCFIGLASYFEAFCKDQFSAIVNIMPQTLVRFTNARDCKISVKTLLPNLSLSGKLGFYLAEEYDFGTGKHVNSLFMDLLSLSPFSQTELARYSEFLKDRNLLVHHGGVFTAKYASQSVELRVAHGIHFESLVVSKGDVKKWSHFLFGVAKKLGQASSKAVLKLAVENFIDLDSDTSRAVRALAWTSNQTKPQM